MSVDYYAGAGERWATGASIVYGPIANALVARAPVSFRNAVVLDAGAGTGVASAALRKVGARPVAIDFSLDMLGWDAHARPPAAVADIRAIPLVDDAVDHGVAAFVLNHLEQPGRGLAELARVIRGGGALVVAVFGKASQSDVRDRVDACAVEAGWRAPRWYAELKATTIPLLGTAPAMERAAREAGLHVDAVIEEATDVGVTSPAQLVDYRFGQAHFATWFASLSPPRASEVRREAIAAITPVMEPYRPVVVTLVATVPTR